MINKLLNNAAYGHLPSVYRQILRCTKRRGMQTIARAHFGLFRAGGLVNLPDGLHMYIPGNKHFIGYLLGNHEDHISELVRNTANAGGVCVDVGGNIGYFALKMAQAVGEKGSVFCYEPDAENYATLQRNAQIACEQTGCKVVTKQVAVSATAASMRLIRGTECTGHQVSAVHDARDAENVVQAVSLDDEFASLDRQVGLVKVDVEGHELDVLRGSSLLLSRKAVRKWVLEIWPGDQAVVIGMLLEQAGYDVQVWLDEGWVKIPLENLPYRTDLRATLAS